MTFHLKYQNLQNRTMIKYIIEILNDRCNTNPFKQLTLIKTCICEIFLTMSLPSRYAIAKNARSTNTPTFWIIW